MLSDWDRFPWIVSLQETTLNDEETLQVFVGVFIMVSVLFGFVHKVTLLFLTSHSFHSFPSLTSLAFLRTGASTHMLKDTNW